MTFTAHLNQENLWRRVFSLIFYAFLLTVFTNLFVPHAAFAASGINKQINFQGKLVDNNGLNVADNTYTVVFSLYTVSSGGAATWTETDSVTTTNGVFQVALGAGTALPGNVDFNQDTWYLGIKVGADAEMTPRVRFAAVPYAFTAASLDGIVATNSAGQFTISGSTNSLQTLTVNGSLTLGSTITPTAAGALTVQSNGTNGLTLDTGGAAAMNIGTTANSITFGATNNPTYSFNGTGAFTVAGGGNSNITFGSSTGNGTIVMQPNAGGQAALIIKDQGVGDIFTASAGATTRFTIANNGNITDSSATAINFSGATLTVASCSGCGGVGSNFWQEVVDASTGSNVLSPATSQLADSLSFGVTGSGTNVVPYSGLYIEPPQNTKGNALVAINQTGLGDIFTASIGAATKFVIDKGGNVGIGVSVPGAKLQVAGGNILVDNNKEIDFYDTDGISIRTVLSVNSTGNTFLRAASSTGRLDLRTQGNNNSLSIDSTGKVGIGTFTSASAPLASLDVRPFSGTIAVASISGQTSFAGMVVDQSGVGDIFTASSSGLSRFTIAKTGAITGSNWSITGAGALTVASCSGCGGVGSNFWQEVADPSSGINILSPASFQLTDGLSFGVTGSGTNVVPYAGLYIEPPQNTKGNALVAINQTGLGDLLTASASGTTRFTLSNSGALTLTSASATAFAIGATGATNPALSIDASTASSVTGLNIKSGALGGGVALSVISSGTNEALTINSKGTGTITLDTPTAGTITIGAVATALNIATSNTASTIGIATGTGANVINIGTGNTLTGITQAIHIGDGTPAGTGLTNISIGNAANTGAVTIKSGSGDITLGSNSGNGNVILSPNAGGQAGLMITDMGTGDLMTASNSAGVTRFRMTNTGGVLFQGDTIASIGLLASAGSPSQTNQTAVANAMGDQGSLVPNAGFESNQTVTKTSNTSDPVISDGWVAAATAAASVVRIATDSAKGTSSVLVKLQPSQSTAIYSPCLPLALNLTGTYTLNFYAKASATNPVVRAYLDEYATQANCQSDTSRTVTAPGGTTTLTAATWKVVGTGATAFTTTGSTGNWARVHLFFGCPASCGANTTIDVDGVRLIEAANTSGLDYAENYPANPLDIPNPGDLVELTVVDGQAVVERANSTSNNSIIGVVSTNPGQVLDDGSVTSPKVPVALAGRVPVNVSTKNGAIHVGDYLSASDVPGVAVKAITPGPVIGTAMQEDTNSDAAAISQITMFVKNSYYGGPSLAGGLTGALGQDTTIAFDDSHSLIIKGNTTQNQAVTIDASGNAVFSGIITAKGINIDQVAGMTPITDELSLLSSQMASLSAQVSSISAVNTASADAILNSITVNGLATISANLRVKSDSLFEGMVHVVDTLMANNIIVNGISEFFNNALFHKDIAVDGHISVLGDTAGTVIISQGQKKAAVVFGTPYPSAPVVTASLSLDETNATNAASLETAFFANGYSYVITQQTENGFTILLNKPATTDVTFTWTALGKGDSIPKPTQ